MRAFFTEVSLKMFSRQKLWSNDILANNTREQNVQIRLIIKQALALNLSFARDNTGRHKCGDLGTDALKIAKCKRMRSRV